MNNLDKEIDDILRRFNKRTYVVDNFGGYDKEDYTHDQKIQLIKQLIDSIIPIERKMESYSSALKNHTTEQYYEDYGYNIVIRQLRAKL